jgi:predicted ferric reductase
MATRFDSVQIWIAAALLFAIGTYLLIANWRAAFILAVIFGVPWIIAAAVVVQRKYWARLLVFLLTGLFTVLWSYFLLLSVDQGAFTGWPQGRIIASTVVSTIPLFALAYCCYVVAKHVPKRTVRT